MNESAASLAALNYRLLQAIAGAAPEGIGELADRAGLAPNNLNRKLESLLAAGLLEKIGESSWNVGLTEAGLRGLGAMQALIAGSGPAAAEADTVYIPLARIAPWPMNPRTQFDPASIEEMSQSIADKGVLQPLIVRPVTSHDGGEGFEVVIGERRRLGAVLARNRGWIDEEALIPCRVRAYSDDEAFEVAVTENAQREDLHWMDEARSFVKLAEMGRSGSQIERLIGGARKKRSIQDYIKIARELPPETLARCYLTEADPQHLSYVKARDLVGEKKERPALELPPRQALALAEVVAAGLFQSGALTIPAAPGQMVVTRFGRAPSGGPLGQLANERKLFAFGFEGRDVVARTPLGGSPQGEDLHRWLTQLGFRTDVDGALWKLRAAQLGEMQAKVLHDLGQWATDELNPPEPVAAQEPPSPMAEKDLPARAGTEGALPVPSVDLPADPAGPPPFVDEDEIGDDDEDHDGDDAPEPLFHRAPTPAPTPAQPEASDLPPMLAIVVIELAHKIAAEGVERGPGTWAAEIRESYYRDGRVMQLVQKHKSLAVMPLNRDKTLAALGKAGLDWLVEQGVGAVANGRPMLDDARLADLQADLGFKPEDGGLYATYWLNGTAVLAAPPAETPQAPPPAEAAAAPTPRRDQFMQSILEVTAESRVLSRTTAALREARAVISTAKTRKLTAREAGDLFALIDSALDAAQALAPAAETEAA